MEGFAKKIQEAKMAVYKQTGRYMPNWMLVSPGMLPVLTFVPGFSASSSGMANGPFVAGQIDGMKVIVSPMLMEEEGTQVVIDPVAGTTAEATGVCYLGVLGNDGATAVGYYAPYIPIVPTQLIQFADGTTQQGLTTLAF